MKRALICGCGYSGRRLGERLLELGLRVVGTTRGAERGRELQVLGIEPLAGELSDPEVLRPIAELAPHVVFYLVPPLLRDPDPLLSVLELAAGPPLEAFVYASSTAVYGDRGGGWVDETDAPSPAAGAPEARCAAEETVLAWGRERGTPTRTCRITGIYGPGRTLRGALERGAYVLVRGGDTWTNRIHVDDLVAAFIAAWQRGRDYRVYNLADDEPHRASQFANLAADLQQLPRPETIDLTEAAARLSADSLRRKMESKRVHNRRMKEELGVALRYPSYRDGLPASVEAEQAGRANE